MNKLQLLKLMLTTVLLIPFAVFSDDNETEEIAPVYTDIPTPPELPDPVVSGEVLKSEATITTDNNGGTITEYRAGGNLYKVKITPTVGPAYYLIDKNGDGEMNCRINKITEDTCVPRWTLFSW